MTAAGRESGRRHFSSAARGDARGTRLPWAQRTAQHHRTEQAAGLETTGGWDMHIPNTARWQPRGYGEGSGGGVAGGALITTTAPQCLSFGTHSGRVIGCLVLGCLVSGCPATECLVTGCLVTGRIVCCLLQVCEARGRVCAHECCAQAGTGWATAPCIRGALDWD